MTYVYILCGKASRSIDRSACHLNVSNADLALVVQRMDNAICQGPVVQRMDNAICQGPVVQRVDNAMLSAG